MPPLQDDCTPACRHREAASSGGLAENGGHHEACKHQALKTASGENIKDLYKTCVRSMVTTHLHQLDRQLDDLSNDEQLWEMLTRLDTMHQQVELMFDVSVERHLGMCFLHLNKSLLGNQGTSLAIVSYR